MARMIKQGLKEDTIEVQWARDQGGNLLFTISEQTLKLIGKRFSSELFSLATAIKKGDVKVKLQRGKK